jgi:L-threonylcarbamoyladenylate synthase
VEALDAPLTSTSANLSGAEDFLDGNLLAQFFGDQVDLIIDAGQVAGQGSTIVDLTIDPPRIVRQGIIKGPLV